MSEKFYVVSEAELNDLLIVKDMVDSGTYSPIAQVKAEAACRSRPLDPQYMPEALFKALIGVKGYSLKGWVKAPEWATHFTEKNRSGESRSEVVK